MKVNKRSIRHYNFMLSGVAALLFSQASSLYCMEEKKPESKRELAATKAASSKPRITIETSDKQEIAVDSDLISRYSKTIKNMLEVTDPGAGPIPIEIIDAQTLNHITGCLEVLDNHPADIDIYLDGIWHDLTEAQMIVFVRAINYLDIRTIYKRLPFVQWLAAMDQSRVREAIRILRGHTAPISSVTISHDGRFVVTGSDDNTARVWYINNGRLIRTLEGHASWLTSVAISPDSRFVVTGACDNTARVRDINTGAMVRTLEGHSDWVTSVAISPDGRFVVTGSDDHTARVWNVRSVVKVLRTNLTYQNIGLLVRLYDHVRRNPDQPMDMNAQDQSVYDNLDPIIRSLVQPLVRQSIYNRFSSIIWTLIKPFTK